MGTTVPAGFSAVCETATQIIFPEPSAREFALMRVLLVGTGRLAARVAEELAGAEDRLIIAGVLDSQPQLDLAAKFPSIPFLGGVDRLQRAILEQCIDEVHVALPLQSCDQFTGLLGRSRELGVPVTFHIPLTSSDVATICVDRHRARGAPHRLVKRTIDVTIAIAAVVLLAPLFALISLAILLTSRGPVFFRQQRVGRGRRQFRMFKFRTMVRNAEELHDSVQFLNNARGISFKVFSDPRVTKVGSILRRCSLDELPQLFNVIRGDMSLVGPRPIPVWIAEQLDQVAYMRRFAVMQGLTGLWQVEGREQDFDRMAAQDLLYIDHWSLGLDLKILARTLPAVLRGEGAH